MSAFVRRPPNLGFAKLATVAAVMALAPIFADAQSAASPFGKPATGTINAISQWQNLPQAVRADLEAQMAPLDERQRQALLATVPSLRNLDAAGINTILATVATDVPLPGPQLDAAFVPADAAVTPQRQFFMGQTFTAQRSGVLTRIEFLMSNPYVGETAGWRDHMGRPLTLPVYPSIAIKVFAGTQAAGVHRPERQNPPIVPLIQSGLGGAATTLGAEPTWVAVDIEGAQIQVTSGQQYTLYLASEHSPIFGHRPPDWYAVEGSDPYPGGQAYRNLSPFVGDFAFKTYVK